LTCPSLYRPKNSRLPCIHYLKADEKGQPGYCKLPTQFRCIEAVKKYCPKLSVSAVNTWIQCRQAYYYSNVVGLQLKPEHLSEPLLAGKAWDNFLQGKPLPEALPETAAARVNALISAYKKLGINQQPDPTYQEEIAWEFGGAVVHGYTDRSYDDHIVESKLSSRPDFYHQLYNIHFQVGTYFLANPRWQHVIMEVTRYPSTRRKEDEPYEDYLERVRKDIIKRPSFYFIGLNRLTMQFGKKFYRSEFDFNGIQHIYQTVSKEIPRALREDAIYQNTASCYSPFPCGYLPIRKSGVVSEELYTIRQSGDKHQ